MSGSGVCDVQSVRLAVDLAHLNASMEQSACIDLTDIDLEPATNLTSTQRAMAQAKLIVQQPPPTVPVPVPGNVPTFTPVQLKKLRNQIFAFKVSSLGDAKCSLGDAESSLGDAKCSLGEAESSLGDA
jgi:hypothetical protein